MTSSVSGVLTLTLYSDPIFAAVMSDKVKDCDVSPSSVIHPGVLVNRKLENPISVPAMNKLPLASAESCMLLNVIPILSSVHVYPSRLE